MSIIFNIASIFHLFLNPVAGAKALPFEIARLPESEIFAQRPPHSDLARFAQEAKLAGMFKLRVDTGGTFTDCWGMAEDDASPRLTKVLSSGRLRFSVGEWLSPTELTLVIPDSWRIADSFFTGYKIESGDRSALILSFEAERGKIAISRALPVSDIVDLFTREEAPVLGARLLTGTPLDHPFPPLDFRLATTRATNALLERKGASVALFVTQRFGDLLTIRDQRRAELFALKHERPSPLFTSVIEVAERLSATGDVLEPIRFDFDDAAAIGMLGGKFR